MTEIGVSQMVSYDVSLTLAQTRAATTALTNTVAPPVSVTRKRLNGVLRRRHVVSPDAVVTVTL
jgi:hypothetical protein